MNEEKAIKLLEREAEKVDQLSGRARFSSEFRGWKARVESLIERFFGKESSHLERFKRIDYSLRVFFSNYS